MLRKGWCVACMSKKILLAYFTIIQCMNTNAAVVNVALNKPISANLTCGFAGPEKYFNHNQIFDSNAQRQKNVHVCQNVLQHPASAMVDGNNSIWWQSTSRANFLVDGYGGRIFKADAIIAIDLLQVFEVQQIILNLGNAKRSKMIGLFKSADGITYTPWVYRVTKDTECQSKFKTPSLFSPGSVNSVVCSPYGTLTPAPFDETIGFDFSGISGTVAAWRNLRYLKIEFYDMVLSVSISASKFHHYAVRQLVILAACRCNGQQITCLQSNATKQYECQCGGNTMGIYCQTCKPFYNQKPFVYGKACESCNCHGHATTCTYNPLVDSHNQSINAVGIKSGGGVCIGCQNYTIGNNCEQCISKFYRPANLLQTAPYPCQSCNCTGPGIRMNIQTGLLGDCVMNNDTLNPLGLVPGDCFCKKYVVGSSCDLCAPGYYNLQPSYVDGCIACECNVAGTINNTTVCESNSTGQCPCKKYVISRRCDTCQDGFYGLSINNTDGCSTCNCDAGGASTSMCNKVSGQCSCRSNIITRQCKKAQTDFFYPGLHFISGQFESPNNRWSRVDKGYKGIGYVLLSNNHTASAPFTIPSNTDLSNQFYIVLRYKSIDLLSPTPSQFSIIGPSVSQNGTLMLPACTNWCDYQLGGVTVNLLFTLNKGAAYTISFAASKGLLMDQVVALPEQFKNTTSVLGAAAAFTFQTTCNIISNDMKLGTTSEAICLEGVLSVSAFYLRGARACQCSVLGAYNNTCTPFEGQCACKPGVRGRRCDACDVEYFRLAADGCISCNCTTQYKMCDPVTGQCLCPPHSTGRQCDTCMTGHWNWTSILGCEACGCNPVGSATPQCNLTTGVCVCKVGVTGPKCDQCADTYKVFSSIGCLQCDCNLKGSLGTVCNKSSGQCPCKANTMGQICDVCKAGAFYLDSSHRYGCLDCVCMGITRSCTSVSYRVGPTKLSVLNATDPTQPGVHVSTEVQTIVATISVIKLGSIDMVQTLLGAASSAYWLLDAGFKGNMLTLYGNEISFDVNYASVDIHGIQNTPTLIVIGYNNTKFYFNVTSVPLGVTTTVNVLISVENIRQDLQGGTVTRGQLMLGLTDVLMVLIPASWFQSSHTTRLGKVQFTHANTFALLGSRARSVEMCSCGLGYKGLSCERCSPGYQRQNVTTQGYLGDCVPCQCNKHSLSCNANTGQCLNCQHNTIGTHCQTCQSGFYGDATQGTSTDCTSCPCYLPRVLNSTCQLVAGKAKCSFCAPGYSGNICDQCAPLNYGNPQTVHTGTCKPCFCNNNTASCDSITGACLNCGFNTTGLQCGTCKDQYFGNATAQGGCQACNCNMSGSVSAICDHTSGNCSCLPGINSRQCDACTPYYYGYSNPTFSGCKPCGCNAHGSLSLQCDEAGVCPCNITVAGAKCDVCATGYWGLPLRPCEACNCNTTGTVNLTLPCDLVTGQCGCKSGVTGRDCGVCDRLYFNFGNNGCERCGRCQDSLGNDTLRMQDTWQGYWNTSQGVQIVQDFDTMLQNLSANINLTLNTLGVSENTLAGLTYSIANLSLLEPSYSSSVNNLVQKTSTIAKVTAELLVSSQSELSRLQALLNQATAAYDMVLSINISGLETLHRMVAYNYSAHQLVKLSNTAHVGINASFDSEQQLVLSELARATATLASMQNIKTTVQAQANKTIELTATAQRVQQQYQNLSTTLISATGVLSTVTAKTGIVLNDLSVTQYNKLRAETLFSEANTALAMGTAMQAKSVADNAVGEQTFADCLVLYSGLSTPSLPLPPPVIAQLNGLKGWQPGQAQLIALYNTTRDLLNLFDATVLAIESNATQLMTRAASVQSVFAAVQSKGQTAVDAINNYEQVVLKLNASLAMALDANKTMAQTQAELQKISVNQLSATANTSLAVSIDKLDNATFWNNTPSALDPLLTAANDSLYQAINQWSDIETRTAYLKSQAAGIQIAAVSPELQANITRTAAYMTKVLDRANNVLVQDAILNTKLDQQNIQVAIIQTTVGNASLLQTQLNNDLSSAKSRIAKINSTIVTTSGHNNTMGSMRSQLELKMATLEAKVAKARAMLIALEQPVSYKADSYEQMANSYKAKDLTNTEISFEFNYALHGEGVLFFAENKATPEKALIQLVNNQVIFEVTNVDETMATTSRAVLCPGCWFRVIATRTGFEGQLTVTKVTTGGVAVSSFRGVSTTHEHLKLSSPLFVGGLPSNYSLNKVHNGSVPFVGCIYNLQFNGGTVPLWQSILKADSTAQCCAPPPALSGAQTLQATTFYGFGFLQKQAQTFTVAQQAQVTFLMRTFSPRSVMLLIDDQINGASSFFGLYMENGKLTFVIRTDSGTQHSVSSARTYFDGNWYKVSAMHNSTYMQIHVQKANFTTNDTVDVKSKSGITIGLSSLANATLTFGGQNPNGTFPMGPVPDSYAGAMRNLQLFSGAALTSIPTQLHLNVLQSKNVNLREAFTQVVKGIGFNDPLGYSILTNIANTVDTVSFDLLTTAPSGILVYAQLSNNPPSTFMYVALVNGDMFMMFNQGLGIRAPLRTRGMYLSTGMTQTVRVDFSYTNSPRLTVNGVIHYGAVAMSSHMYIFNRLLYIGGVPSGIGLAADSLPVKHNLGSGGLSNIKINAQPVDLFAGTTVSQTNQRAVYLSGLTAPRSSPPPLPYTTTPAPPTTPSPTCAPKPSYSISNVGVRFGDLQPSFMTFNISQQKSIFTSAFAIKMRFRAVQPNGLLLYLCDAPSNPTYYFAVYLQNGNLVASMQSNRRQSTTKGITSKYKYNNGQWTDMEVLRINDFMALIVTKTKDYKNNLGQSQVASILDLNYFHVGGVPATYTGMPFATQITKQSFRGCIQSIVSVTHQSKKATFDLSAPLLSEGISQCYQSVVAGTFMNGTLAFSQVVDFFNVIVGIKINVSFSSVSRDGTLVAIWAAADRFLLLTLQNGDVLAIIGQAGQVSSPFVARSAYPVNTFVVCDNKPHTLVFSITIRGVMLKVDANPVENFLFPSGFTFTPVYAAPLTVGIKSTQWKAPPVDVNQSFRGCIHKIELADVPYSMLRATHKAGLVAGCPTH